jgi:hypothetical protein
MSKAMGKTCIIGQVSKLRDEGAKGRCLKNQEKTQKTKVYKNQKEVKY